ncbi:MAG: PaaI family thioesterase [Alphaproteobacteria bacterium]|nr:PaaI family thioesterase [Alphaproteobacteria bacterium]
MNDTSATVGVVPIARAATMSGLEFLQGLLAGTLPRPPIAVPMRFVLVAAERGRAVFEGETDESLLNPFGTVHGGWAMTLLDSAMSCAVLSALPAGQAQTTVEVKINLVRPIFPATGRVRVEGALIHQGRQLATAEGRLLDAEGRLLAHGTTTCMIFELARAGA